MTPDTIRALARSLRASSFDRARMHDALVTLASRIRTPALAKELVVASGLSLPMVDFALETSTRVLTPEGVARIAERVSGRSPVGLAGVVLSSNVTTAALRALAVPLACGAPVLVKASSRDGALALAFARALRDVDPACAARLGVIVYEGGDATLDAAFVAACDTVHVYGSDPTIAAFRALAGERLFPHGHGLGVAVVSPDASLEDAARAVALDVAAYDQRGCLSPHAAYVIGDAARTERFAHALADALDALERTLPRGPLDGAMKLAESSARALAVMEGDVIESAASTVALASTFRPSPGARFVRVIAAPTEVDVYAALTSLAPHLTCIGVAGALSEALLHAQPRFPRAAIVPAGTMQMPSLDAPVDGRPCEEGFVVTERRA